MRSLMILFALAFVLVPLVAASSPQTYHHPPRTYITCPGTADHQGGYYYNVSPDSKHGLLNTLTLVAQGYRVTLASVLAFNPLATATQILAVGTSVCIPYV